MIKIEYNTAQLILPFEDRRKLRQEMITALSVLDDSTPANNYSIEALEIKYPALCEFYNLIGWE